ncbi:transcriptional regulator [Halobacteroides halobius DSM 5150]|uniref:Transcriptional regulator n=1 Tax=Halobacteroides halobius (strain ATCC 35273 / DSM 5150 / MD-1) TaxID=748449 RepID=L0K6V7_HALHC|nr:GntR family transcriptional regulator [Halobacteroides halobius]AGB40756.1 transcriptional regulator [Halobacteroides halobius DSM 5150]
MDKISKDKPTPLYYQLKELLRQKIETDELTPGDRLPVERELCEKHDISRMTARKAIMALVNEGLVYREQGRGTFVAEPEPKMKHELSRLKGFTKEMKEKGLEIETKILLFELKEATKGIKDYLKILNENTKVIKMRRLRIVENEPFAIETVWVPYYLCPNLSKEKVAGSSLYEIFQQDYNYELDHAKQTVEPIMLSEYESDLLKVSEKDLALLYRRKTYLSDNKIIEYVKSVYRTDKYKHEVILNNF